MEQQKKWVIEENEIKQDGIGSICAVNTKIEAWEQNLKLIAAAPEMFNLLNDIKEKLEDAEFWEQIDKVVSNDIEPILNKFNLNH